jgi:hypothetical protein
MATLPERLTNLDPALRAFIESSDFPPAGTMPAPPPLPPGRVLAHNNIQHTPEFTQGLNGFRFWYQDANYPGAPPLRPCTCGYAPEHPTHYQVTGG